MKSKVLALVKGENSKIYMYIILASMILIGACLFWVTGNRSISNSVLDSQYLFSDYYYHINYSALKSDIYLHPELPICLPPLAYLLYTFLWRLEPNAYYDDWNEIKYNGNAPVVFLLTNLITVLLLVYLVYCYFKDTEIKMGTLIIFSLLIICSYPCINTSLQRGNSVFLVAIIVGFAFYLMNSESKTAREIALILIAVAAGLKTYPALCGLYYISQKRYKETIRLVIYGVICCLLPFVFFGGIDGLMGFLNNVFNYASGSFSRWCTLRGYFGMTLKTIGLDNLNEDKLSIVAVVMEAVFTVVMILMMIISKVEWKKVLYLMAIVVLIPSGNWMYTLVYLLVPFLMYLSNNEDINSKVSKVYCILFAIIFCQPFFFETGLGRVMNWGSVGWIYSLVFFLLLICCIEEIIGLRKK